MDKSYIYNVERHDIHCYEGY